MASGWLGIDWRDVDWGNVPAWFGAVITSASASVAALSYRKSVNDKEMEQASKVAAWIGVKEIPGGRTYHLYVSNTSSGPIYDISVELFDQSKIAQPSLAPDSTYDTEIGADGVNSKSTIVVKLKYIVASLEARAEIERVAELPLEMIFRDSLGRWWKRDSSGRVRRTSNNSAHLRALELNTKVLGLKATLRRSLTASKSEGE